ncbi:uncharacterized protein OCT59_015232 [Rhizophagus irregularis]|uniref:uncharacterized protein n=1 Tax=Rhizophagus irregularis TaxID=588596 RepID=UPI00332CAA67|nr:hypothetical protein OCT59_015232 [Rhizophagus irregularis]
MVIESRLYPKFNGNTETGKEEIYGPADRRRSGSRLQRHIRDSKQRKGERVGSPFGPTNKITTTTDTMEEEVTTNTKVIIADKIQVITILKGNKEDTDNITKDTTHNIDNRHDDQMHIDLMEKVTTFITNLMIRDLHPTQEIIDTTNIIKNSEKAEEIMTEDQTDEDPTTTEITILNKDIIDTYNNIIITEEKHIITEEKKSTEESKTIDIMMMDTNIDEQTMTMIEEEKTGSIMDIDIESTSRTINNETTSSTNNKRKDTGHFRNKFSGKEWEEIAERVENSIIERQMDIDENVESNEEVTSEIDKKWTKLKNVITKVITETKQEIRTKTNTTMNTKKEYNSNINEMSDCDRVKTKLKIIKEIEQCWKKWNKLTMEKNESNVKTRWNLDMMENFGARERKVITKYKILVHRFNDICNMKMTTEAFKQNITLHDNLEDSTSINIAKIKLEKEKSRLLCDMI